MNLPRLHKSQTKILNEAKRFNVVDCGRRFGKTTSALNLVCETAIDGFPAGWFAPEYRLLREAWRELNDTLAPVILSASYQEKRIELITGGIIDAWSFDRNPNAGRSRRYKRVVIDEAAHCSNLREVWTRAVRPTLTDYKGDAWFLSSPNGKEFFYQLWLKGLSPTGPWKSWKMTSYDNPHLDPVEIDAAEDDLGPKMFSQEYLAEFLDDILEGVIPSEWLDLASQAKHWPGGPNRMAIDLAEGNNGDDAGVMVRDDNGIKYAKTSPNWSLETTATKAALIAQRFKITGARITYDAGGVGSDFSNRLEAVGLFGAMAYKGGMSGGTSFTNLRTAAAWVMRQRLDPKTVNMTQKTAATPLPFAIPPEILIPLRPELLALKYTIEKDRRKALEPKEEMTADLGHSPTHADMLIMSFAFPST